jgi:hypothetical protein
VTQLYTGATTTTQFTVKSLEGDAR